MTRRGTCSFTMSDVHPPHRNLMTRGVSFWTFYVINELYLRGKLDGRAHLVSVAAGATASELVEVVIRRRIRFIVPLDCADAEFVADSLPEVRRRCGPVRRPRGNAARSLRVARVPLRAEV